MRWKEPEKEQKSIEIIQQAFCNDDIGWNWISGEPQFSLLSSASDTGKKVDGYILGNPYPFNC